MQVKLRIGCTLSDRFAPISCAIVENLKRSALIEELPSAAIEAMLHYSKELAVTEESSWLRESWVDRGEAPDVLTAFRGWHDQVLSIIEAADEI